MFAATMLLLLKMTKSHFSVFLFFLQGQLKEKKGKWKVFKRWKTRYFTLSGGTFTYSKSNSVSTYLKMIIVQTLTGAIRDFVYNLLPVP